VAGAELNPKIMTILFPSHPLRRSAPDPDFASEAAAAQAAGLDTEYFSLECLRAGDLSGAFGRCNSAPSPGEPLVHRGWMMCGELYGQLHRSMVELGFRPVTDPDQYAEAHYLPNAYPHLLGDTAESVWITGRNIDDAWNAYQQLSAHDCLVKDFVKSAKHRWVEACFIPAGTERGRFEEIMAAFLQARGNLFEKGIVFRRFHLLVELERDLRGQPVNEEYRMFFWGGRLLAAAPAVREPGPLVQLPRWQELVRRFRSHFMTMDVARTATGDWLVIEVGDGGVSGLPFSIEAAEFFQSMARQGFPE
jgi:hypothetical protein